jgi:hypothetical protein
MRRRLWLGGLLAWASFASVPFAAAQNLTLRELGEEWQSLPLRGQSIFRFWGLEIYEASLWLPAEAGTAWSAHRLVLSLHYRRNFSAQDIAQRSLQEMLRQGPLADTVAQQWQRQLTEALSDVRAGERLTAVYDPQKGLRFWHHAQSVRVSGQIDDRALAHKFLGIWLSESTSAPAMRQALLGLKSSGG